MEAAMTTPARFPTCRAPVATRDLDQLNADVVECGYGILLEALSPALLAGLKARVLEQAAGERAHDVAYYFGDDQTGMPGTHGGHRPAPNQRLGNLLNKGEVFRELLNHPLAAQAVPPMLGPDYLLSSLSAMIMQKGGVAQVIHADQQFVPFRTPQAVVCNIVWMLVDFRPKNGATRLVPGSHLWDPPEIRFERDADGAARLMPNEAPVVIAEAPAGSALVFDGRLWHGAGANTTQTPRPALFSYYCAPFLRQQENIPVSLRDEVYATLTPAELKVLGFEAHNRGLGRIAPVIGRANPNWSDNGAGILVP
jgi:hypothetical protein